jgi:hypothetical protein
MYYGVQTAFGLRTSPPSFGVIEEYLNRHHRKTELDQSTQLIVTTDIVVTKIHTLRAGKW